MNKWTTIYTPAYPQTNQNKVENVPMKWINYEKYGPIGVNNKVPENVLTIQQIDYIKVFTKKKNWRPGYTQ